MTTIQTKIKKNNIEVNLFLISISDIFFCFVILYLRFNTLLNVVIFHQRFSFELNQKLNMHKSKRFMFQQARNTVLISIFFFLVYLVHNFFLYIFYAVGPSIPSDNEFMRSLHRLFIRFILRSFSIFSWNSVNTEIPITTKKKPSEKKTK